jgi:hypothetical protein
MLTADQILQAIQLMHQVGELRPGSVQDGASNLSGPACSYHSRAVLPAVNEPRSGGEASADVSVAFEKDPRTGKLRFKTL